MEPEAFTAERMDTGYLIDVYATDDPAIVEALAIAQAARDAGLVENGKLRTIIGTLPVTADGCVPVVGCDLWVEDGFGEVEQVKLLSINLIASQPDDPPIAHLRNPIGVFALSLDRTYSTRSAAEAAKGGGDAAT
jgi:hypothetical protein